MVTPKLLPIISWQTNLVPLSVVIDLTCSLNGDSKCIIVRASSFASFPYLSFLINSILVLRSISVTMAPWFPFPTIVSISKFPKRFPSTSVGLSLILVLLGMRLLPTGLAQCFSLWRQCLVRSAWALSNGWKSRASPNSGNRIVKGKGATVRWNLKEAGDKHLA